MIASGLTIGRFRGQHEEAQKALRSAQNGHRDPLKAGFLDIARAADLSARAGAFFCGQIKEGRLIKGVADEKWARATAEIPLAKLDVEKLHVFLPETREVKLRGGHVFVRADGAMFAFCEPELFAELGTGFALAVKFDPSEPTLGCALFNREAGSANRFNFGLGQYLGHADYVPDAPQLCAHRGFLTEEEQAAFARRKKYNNGVRTEYRTIGVFGRRAVAISGFRDGKGNVVEVETGGTARGAENAPAGGGEFRREGSTTPCEIVPGTRAMSRHGVSEILAFTRSGDGLPPARQDGVGARRLHALPKIRTWDEITAQAE